MFEQTIVFCRSETTGGSIVHDRITEVGIIEVGPAGVSEWSTLVNPQTRIPPFIEKLTGISNAMVESAPTFAEVAEEVLGRLVGSCSSRITRFRLWFPEKRVQASGGLSFRATVAWQRQAVAAAVSRVQTIWIRSSHAIDCPLESRHRALADARAVAVHYARWSRAPLAAAAGAGGSDLSPGLAAQSRPRGGGRSAGSAGSAGSSTAKTISRCASAKHQPAQAGNATFHR